MTLIPKEEINPLINLLDPNSSRGCVVPENQLLEVKERPPVGNMLPELHRSNPLIRIGLKPRARLAEVVPNGVLDGVRLLEHSAVEDLGLNRELDFDTFGVGLGPDELGVLELDFVEVLEAFDAEGEELFGLPLGFDPSLGGLEVAAALGAVEDLDALLEAFGDVHFRAEAVDAHVGCVGRHGDAALAAQDASYGLLDLEHPCVLIHC